nr:hypothetical protein [Halorubellus salinus]
MKDSGDGLALQITKPARTAGLVDERDTPDGKTPTYRAETRVHAFAGLLVVVDTTNVDDADEAELVATAARETDSAYQSMTATVQIAGHGYQLQLPPASDASLTQGDTPAVVPAPGLLVIGNDDVDGRVRPTRIAEDLVTIRRDQDE